jgi:hypothetical protein
MVDELAVALALRALRGRIAMIRTPRLLSLAVGLGCLAAAVTAQAQSIPLDDGSVYWPAPGMYQPVMNELWQNTQGACDGDRCNTGMDWDDPDALAISHENEAAAATSTAAPGVQINPNPAVVPSNQPYQQTFHKDEDFGNGTFGAGYALDGTVRATPVIPLGGGSAAQIVASADATTFARVFGNTANVATAQLRLSTRPEGGPSTFGLFFLGTQVYSANVAPGPVRDEKLFSRSFVKFATDLQIFGIGVRVEAAVTGNAGATYEGTYNAAGVRATLTPQSAIFATASASVGVNIFVASVKVGVEGMLTLISVKAPIVLKLGAASCSELEALLGSDLQINTLSGRVSAFLKVRIAFIKKKKFFTLASFPGSTRGLTGAVSLATPGTRQPFYQTCTSQLQGAIAQLATATAPPPPPPPAPTPTPGPTRNCPHCQIQ